MNLGRMLAISTLWCAAVASAQTQTRQPATSPNGDAVARDAADPQTTSSQQRETVGQELTLSGCLMRHREVPTRSGALSTDITMKHDGYILVDASTVAHHKGVNGMRPGAAATSAAHDHTSADATPPVDRTQNAGDSQMFKIEGLPDVDLEPLAGTRVTLMGDLIAQRTGPQAVAVKDADHDAAPFEATMVHPSSTPCRQ